jgi:branched-subunit amino acid aminotransferase/4-amino-4-deoxychorismate lyase
MLVSLNGKIIPEETAAVSPFHSGLYYGTGCFETIRAEYGKLLFFDDHVDRLTAGLSYLGLPVADTPERQLLLENSKELLRQNGLLKGIAKVRIQCSVAEKNGYAVEKHPTIITMITAEEYRAPVKPKSLIMAETTVIPSSSKPANLKLSNMLHYRNAYREAQKDGADDAVMLTESGYVSETSIANLFWCVDRVIYTPSVDCDFLPGISRKYMLKAIQSIPDYSLSEGRFKPEHLLKADFAWMTNSLIEVHPVGHIDGKEFDTDYERFENLFQLYFSYKKAL